MIHLNWHALWYFFFLCLANLGSCVCVRWRWWLMHARPQIHPAQILAQDLFHMFFARAGHNKGVVDFFDVLRKNFSPARCGKQYVCNCREAHTEHGLLFFCEQGVAAARILENRFFITSMRRRGQNICQGIQRSMNDKICVCFFGLEIGNTHM